jgi:5-methylcytosine-specific restriction protein A
MPTAGRTYAWQGGSSRRWRKLRERHLLQEPLCRLCLGIDKRVVAATDVDHVTPVSEGGGMWDPRNLQSLCAEHHSAKTTSERTGKPMHIKGCTADGLPRDPNHPWRKE